MIDEKLGNMVEVVMEGGIGGIEGWRVVEWRGGEGEMVGEGKGWVEEG